MRSYECVSVMMHRRNKFEIIMKRDYIALRVCSLFFFFFLHIITFMAKVEDARNRTQNVW